MRVSNLILEARSFIEESSNYNVPCETTFKSESGLTYTIDVDSVGIINDHLKFNVIDNNGKVYSFDIKIITSDEDGPISPRLELGRNYPIPPRDQQTFKIIPEQDTRDWLTDEANSILKDAIESLKD